MKLVFMGTPEFAVPALEAVLRSDFPVVGVVTQPDRPRGRGEIVTPSPVKKLALAHHVPVLQPLKMKAPEFLKAIRDWRPDVIVVVAFGRILPKEILDVPPRGCINVHASLLPKYRGAAPIQWAVINGESQTGVTTMLMDEGMDTGAILMQESTTIGQDETAGDLSTRLAGLGAKVLIETLHGWQSGRLQPRSQDDSKATMAPMLKKEDGKIDWTQKALVIANRIRGVTPWPGAYTFCQEERLKIWRAIPWSQDESAILDSGEPSLPGTIVSLQPQGMLVATGQGLLVVQEVQPANRTKMSIQQFVAGRRVRPGMKLTGEPVGPESGQVS